MSDVPVQVVVAAFKDEASADDVLKSLKEAKKQGLIKIVDAAVLRKDDKGKLHIKETADMGGGKGAVIGGVLGGVIGLLAGPIGWAALGGAVIGGLAAKMRDGGFKDDRLKKLGEGLGPATRPSWRWSNTPGCATSKSSGRSGCASCDRGIQRRHRPTVGWAARWLIPPSPPGMLWRRDAWRSAIRRWKRPTRDDRRRHVSEGVVATKDEVVAGAAMITSEGVTGIVVEAKAEPEKLPEGEAKPEEASRLTRRRQCITSPAASSHTNLPDGALHPAPSVLLCEAVRLIRRALNR